MKSRWLLLLVGLVLCAGCREGEAEADNRFQIVLRGLRDDGSPLAGVAFKTGQLSLGTTGEAGTVEVRLRGTEGQLLTIEPTCPSGFDAKAASSQLRLTRTRRLGSAGAQALALDATCVPQERDVVVVVRTQKAAQLPVHVDGKLATTTTADGTAHVLLSLPRDAKGVTVALDTSREPRLRPQNPSRQFELHGKDAIVVMDQEFAETPKPRARVSTAAPKRHVPYRLQ